MVSATLRARKLWMNIHWVTCTPAMCSFGENVNRQICRILKETLPNITWRDSCLKNFREIHIALQKATVQMKIRSCTSWNCKVPSSEICNGVVSRRRERGLLNRTIAPPSEGVGHQSLLISQSLGHLTSACSKLYIFFRVWIWCKCLLKLYNV